MEKKWKMNYRQRRTNIIVSRHDMTRSRQRRGTKRRSRRLRISFHSTRMSLVFFSVLWHLLGEKVSEKTEGENNKTNKHKNHSLCLPFFSFLSFFLFSPVFLSLSGRKKSPKSPKITKNAKITKSHPNFRKSLKTL